MKILCLNLSTFMHPQKFKHLALNSAPDRGSQTDARCFLLVRHLPFALAIRTTCHSDKCLSFNRPDAKVPVEYLPFVIFAKNPKCH